MSFKVKFWSVRGSIACPSAKYVTYGGNTSCIEVALGGRRIILDCGTGLRNLGKYFSRKDTKHAHIFLTHTHWCIAPGSLDTSLSHAAGLSDIAVCHA